MIPNVVVLILTSKRPKYLAKTLKSIFNALGCSALPIIVSEQGSDSATKKVLSRYKGITHIQFPKVLTFEVPVDGVPGYYYLTEHYRAAFTYLFDELAYQNLIVIEDDLEVSKDFFTYFEDTFPLLEQDSTIWSISAFNDNGFPKIAYNPAKLYRSDFFPGLGWLLTKNLWDELKSNWPTSHWDEWMRNPEQRKGRVTIRPEVSRSSTFGKKGVSNGQYYKKYLRRIKLNTTPVRFSESDIKLYIKDNYDRDLKRCLAKAVRVEPNEIPKTSTHDLFIEYDSPENFSILANKFGIMPDFWSDVPRTGYQGVVSFRYKDNNLYLCPNNYGKSI